MSLNDFLALHTVFTVGDLDRFLSERGSGNAATRKSLLAYHRRKGHVIPVRRGLYAAVPRGMRPGEAPVDPFLIAARLTEDAVLAYHTALEFHGRARSIHWTVVYLSARRSLPMEFRSHEYRRAPVPPSLLRKDEAMFGVIRRRRSGVEIRVTSYERTLVDVLDRPDLTGEWEEIWRSLELVEFFDLDQVVEYARLLDNATTAAKVGFFLQQHRDDLMVGDAHLDALRRMRPRQPHYLMRARRRDCKWVRDWNLMVPEEVLNRSWEEMP
jgi:predicted transcriptional regulator of viral defense system